jgi:broad specificity phosphatase PhoE
MKQYYKEYVENDGEHPNNENKKWETKEQLKTRVMSVINKYKDTYNTIIIVAHKMAFQCICDCGDMKPAQIFEVKF